MSRPSKSPQRPSDTGDTKRPGAVSAPPVSPGASPGLNQRILSQLDRIEQMLLYNLAGKLVCEHILRHASEPKVVICYSHRNSNNHSDPRHDKQRYDLLDERLPLPKDEADFVMRMFSVLLPVVRVENLQIMCSCEIDLTSGTPPEVKGATLVLIGSSKYNKITKHVFDHWRTQADKKPNLWFEPMDRAGQFMVREQRQHGCIDHQPTYHVPATHQPPKLGIMKDYGIIAKCPNPFHPGLSAFVFGGCRMASQIAIERILFDPIFDPVDGNGNSRSWHEAVRESKLFHVRVDVEYQYVPQGKPILEPESLKVTLVRI